MSAVTSCQSASVSRTRGHPRSRRVTVAPIGQRPREGRCVLLGDVEARQAVEEAELVAGLEHVRLPGLAGGLGRGGLGGLDDEHPGAPGAQVHRREDVGLGTLDVDHQEVHVSRVEACLGEQVVEADTADSQVLGRESALPVPGVHVVHGGGEPRARDAVEDDRVSLPGDGSLDDDVAGARLPVAAGELWLWLDLEPRPAPVVEGLRDGVDLGVVRPDLDVPSVRARSGAPATGRRPHDSARTTRTCPQSRAALYRRLRAPRTAPSPI